MTGAWDRFIASMEMNYEKWHDGIGYDLLALEAASPEEKARIEALLLSREPSSWCDIEALAQFDSPAALHALRGAARHHNGEVRGAVLRYAPHALQDGERVLVLRRALREADFFSGLSAALEEIETFHPPEVVDLLLMAALEREGTVAVHCAAMLLFIHGKAPEPFDMAQRPFFLSFAEQGEGVREAAFRDLCQTLAVRPEIYLAQRRS